MVKVSFDLTKRWAVFFGALIVFTGLIFVFAYGGTNPKVVGHNAGEIMVGVNGQETNLQDAINRGMFGTKINTLIGKEIYLGEFTIYVDHILHKRIPINTENAIAGFKIVISGGHGDHCKVGQVLYLNASTNWKASCDSKGPRKFTWSADYCTGVNWHSFDVYDLSGSYGMRHGVKQINWFACDGTRGWGVEKIKLYLIPYVFEIPGFGYFNPSEALGLKNYTLV